MVIRIMQNLVSHTEHLCPVCGYEMEDPPSNYNICPSCGTEFGVNDVNASALELRMNWIASGMEWWSTTDAKPVEWAPLTQLARLSGFSASSAINTKTVQKVDWAAQAWPSGHYAGTQYAVGRR
jgi:hypothetical protein